MAPRGKNNPYYRTNEQLANDVFNVLRSSDLSVGAKHAVIYEVTWLWTESEGKYTGCRYWSREASEYINASETVKSKTLRHDHVVPRNQIIKRLLYGEVMGRDELYDFLTSHLVGCIVLIEEDLRMNELGFQRSMPDGWTFGDDVWGRYLPALIDVCEIKWNGKVGSVI